MCRSNVNTERRLPCHTDTAPPRAAGSSATCAATRRTATERSLTGTPRSRPGCNESLELTVITRRRRLFYTPTSCDHLNPNYQKTISALLQTRHLALSRARARLPDTTTRPSGTAKNGCVNESYSPYNSERHSLRTYINRPPAIHPDHE